MAKIVTQSKNGVSRQRLENPSSNEQNEIQQLAYQFFVERNYQQGHDHEDWLRAESIVKNRKRS